MKILTTPWRDTVQQRPNVVTVANGAVRQSFITVDHLNSTKELKEIKKEQTEVSIQQASGAVSHEPPPEPV